MEVRINPKKRADSPLLVHVLFRDPRWKRARS